MGIVIALMIGIIISTIDYVRPNNEHIANFMNEKADIDVCFYGSSHAYNNIEPNALWEEYGIASYALANPEQPMSVTYHTMANSFKVNKPKVAMVELYMVRYALEKEYDQNRKRNQYTNGVAPFPLTIEKYEAAEELLLPEEKWGGFFYFPMYHGNYETLTKNSVEKEQWEQRGFTLVFSDLKGKEVDTEIQTYSTYLKGPEGELAEETQQSLGRIIDLCEENQVELVFFVAPYMVSEGEAIGYANIKKWLEEKNVSFLDMNNHIDEIGIVWESDMCDIGHANYWGAAKNSEWLGQFLKDNYEIPDRRADSKYGNWNKCNQVLDALLLKNILEKEASLEEVAKILNQHKENLIISVIAGKYAGQKEIAILENNGFCIGKNDAIYIENGALDSKYETMEKTIRVDNDVYFGKDSEEKVFCQIKNEYLASDAIGIIVYSDDLGEVIYLKEYRSDEILSE